jgi:WD40 repeat protein
MLGTWRTVRVFLSSTFRDMHAERDHLVKVTFPELRQWCAERRLHLVDIDLRWGVPREEADDGRSLIVCLQEIDACRPFFLCLLGERYGWVPGAERIPPEAYDRFPGLRARIDCSITHLEVLHALEQSLDPGASRPPCRQAFCYFRRPDCLPRPEEAVGLTEEERRTYQEAFLEQDERPARALAELKAWLRGRLGAEGRVFEYGGVWNWNAANPEDDTLKGRLTQLEGFGSRVTENLKRAIATEFAGHLAALDGRDPLAEERSLHEAFVEGRTRVHVPRVEVEAQLNRYVEGEDPRPLVLSGPPGTGKSALLAHWVKQRLAPGREGELVVARFIGASPASSNLPGLLGNVCAELASHFGLTEEVAAEDSPDRKAPPVRPLEVPADPVRLLQKWPAVLKAAGRRGRAVIVLDALEQLDRSANPGRLEWLPRPLPAGVRLVVSVLDQGDVSRPDATVREGTGAEPPDWLSRLRLLDLPEVALPILTDEDRRRIVHELPSVFCKTLDPGEVAGLLANPATRNPLFLTVALEELRVCGSFEKLAAAIDRLPRLDDPDVGADIDRALDRLFGQVLSRLEQETDRHTPGLVAALFGLLAASRDGLSESELRGAIARRLPRIAETERDGTLQVVLRQVRPYLMWKGLRHGTLIDFYHRSFWKAARTRFLAGAAACRQAHRGLADYFQAEPDRLAGLPGGLDLPNERKLTELPWQLLQTARQAGPDLSPEKRREVWELPTRLLADPTFLEAKTQAGLVSDLVGDFADVLELLPADQPGKPLLKLLDEALRADLEFLARHPTCLFPCLWNRGWWYDSPDAEPYQEAHGPAALPKGQLSAFLETWRAAKEHAEPGFRWARCLQPPTQPLGSALRLVLSGHTDMVSCVAFGPDGNRLASGSHDGTVRLWDARTGFELLCLGGHEAPVLAVVFTPDGRRLLSTAADQAVSVSDVPSGVELARLDGSRGQAVAAAFSPDGRHIALAVAGILTVRETATGAVICRVERRRRPMTSLAWAPKGQRISMASEDGTIFVLETRTGRELLRWTETPGPVWALAVSPDGRKLASAAGTSIRVWDAAAGRELARLLGHTRAALCLAWSPDGRRLASGGGPGGNAVRVWDVNTGRQLTCQRGHRGEVRAVAFAPDGRQVASGGGMLDNTVRVWDAEAATCPRRRGGHEGPLKCLAFSSDGRRLATGGGMFDNTVRLWDERGREIACLRGHTGDVLAVAFSPDGRRLASGSRDRTVRLWDLASGRDLACLRGHFAEVRAIAFTPDGLRLATGAHDRTVRLWDTDTGRERLCLRGMGTEVWSVAFSPGGDLLAAGSFAGGIRIWQLPRGALLSSWDGHRGTVGCLAFTPDGQLISFGADEQTVRTWEPLTGAAKGVLSGIGGLGDVAALAAGPSRFPWRAVARGDETVVEASATGEPGARLPVALSGIVAHPSGRTWAGIERGHLYFAERSHPYLFTLEESVVA